MSQQAQQLRKAAEQLQAQGEVISNDSQIWQMLTTPANILKLLDTVEAEQNQLKAARAAA